MTRPLPGLLYHGTAESFPAFDLDRGSPNRPDGLGAWLTESVSEATDFAVRGGRDGVVLHVEHAFRNPLVLASMDELRAILRSDRNRARETRGRLLTCGYDAVVIDRSAGLYDDDAREVVALGAGTVRVVAALEPGPASPAFR